MEVWRPFDDWCDVSNQGNVRSWRGKGRKPVRRLEPFVLAKTKHSRGYLMVRSGGRAMFVHRMVLEVFAGPGEGLECRHLNGDKTDNRWPENLSWGTALENARDRARHGTATGGRMPGAGHPNSKLDREQARVIFLSTGRQRDIAAMFGVHQAVVHNIKARKSYAAETADL